MGNRADYSVIIVDKALPSKEYGQYTRLANEYNIVEHINEQVLNTGGNMTFFYIICAVAGGTLVICQFVMTLMGLGGDDFAGDAEVGDIDVPDADFGGDLGDISHHDAAAHPSSNWIFGILSFRTLVAGITFFGLAGWGLSDTGLQPGVVMMLSIGVGLVAVFIVATIMRSLSRLNLDGTVRIQRSVGRAGTVYLSIPAAKGGTGKIHVPVQGCMKEYKAITSDSELPTGTKVVVVKVVTGDTVEVAPAESREESAANVAQT